MEQFLKVKEASIFTGTENIFLSVKLPPFGYTIVYTNENSKLYFLILRRDLVLQESVKFQPSSSGNNIFTLLGMPQKIHLS